MKTLFINGLKFTFNKVVEFKEHETDLFECFFFKNEVLIGSQFLTLFEFNKLKTKK